MKNIAIKLLVVSAVMLTSACSGPDALFPSLLGSDSQENSLDGNGAVRNNSYRDVRGSKNGTFVGQKIVAFRKEFEQIKVSDKNNNEELQRVRGNILNNTTQYNKVVGGIETKLQVGTTPGNPNLYNTLQQAQDNTQTMSLNANALENLSARVTNDATSIGYLIDSIRAAFSISGAVDEDHRQLRNLLSETEQLQVVVNSLNNEVNNDATRQQQYVATAQNQINRLNSAIRVGSFQGAQAAPVYSNPALFGSNTTSMQSQARAGKPLFIAKFKKNNVNYKEGLSTAVKAAVNRKSNAVFEIVAVSDAVSKNKAQEHAGKIFEEIVAMGVNASNININAKTSAKTNGAEVWIFVK